MGALGAFSVLVVMAFLGILSNVDCHMILTGDHSRSLSQSRMESRDSPVVNVPKYFSREEAKRVSIARWKKAQSLAAASRPHNTTVSVLEMAHFSAN